MISVDWKPIYFIATLHARFTENLPQPLCLLAFFQIFFSFIQLFQHTASAFPSPRDLADEWQRFFQQSRSSSEGAWAPVLLAQQDKADIKLYSLFSQVSYSQATGGEIVLTLWRGEDLDQPGDKSQYYWLAWQPSLLLLIISQAPFFLSLIKSLWFCFIYLDNKTQGCVSELSSSRLGCLQVSVDLCIISLLRLNGTPGKAS